MFVGTRLRLQSEKHFFNVVENGGLSVFEWWRTSINDYQKLIYPNILLINSFFFYVLVKSIFKSF